MNVDSLINAKNRIYEEKLKIRNSEKTINDNLLAIQKLKHELKDYSDYDELIKEKSKKYLKYGITFGTLCALEVIVAQLYSISIMGVNIFNTELAPLFYCYVVGSGISFSTIPFCGKIAQKSVYKQFANEISDINNHNDVIKSRIDALELSNEELKNRIVYSKYSINNLFENLLYIIDENEQVEQENVVCDNIKVLSLKKDKNT